MIVTTLPVLLALSWVPATNQPVPAAQSAQAVADRAAQAETITCPLTGNKIPSCCCPVKK